ncbi:hypothetical protein ACFL35_13930 [Candidatus Riflebacteria bacterium]
MIPNFSHDGRRRLPQRECMATLRVIAGALEMYNMDHKKGMKSLNLAQLQINGYLKTFPKCVKDGIYAAKHENPEKIYKTVKCSVHGSILKPQNPDPSWASINRQLHWQRNKHHILSLCGIIFVLFIAFFEAK